jgi:hypothetical protein
VTRRAERGREVDRGEVAEGGSLPRPNKGIDAFTVRERFRHAGVALRALCVRLGPRGVRGEFAGGVREGAPGSRARERLRAFHAATKSRETIRA